MLFTGDKGTLLNEFTGGVLFLNANSSGASRRPKTLPRSTGHYMEWVAAAKGGKPANCNFEFAGPVTEIALLGVIAQRTGKYWYGTRPTCASQRRRREPIRRPAYRAGWSL